MAVLQVSNITKYFSNTLIFKGVNFVVNEKERVALVGPNGSGKSTLIKIIMQEEDFSLNKENEEPGKIFLLKNTTIGYLSQNVISNVNNTLLEEALSVFSMQIQRENELDVLSNNIALNPNDKNIQKEYARKLSMFEANGGYDYHYTIEMILQKFGFKKDDFSRRITSFSGGERTKIAFAKLLLIKPDLLILDEPTNHLDISTIEWLEDYLKHYSGSILFVSHDRYFIDSIADKILELENTSLTTYKGNYTKYLEQKRLNYESQLKSYNIQQKEIQKLTRFIEYFKPKPRFVSRAKDREKKLEHMKLIDKPNLNNDKINFAFKGEIPCGKKILVFENCVFGYQFPLFDSLNFTFMSDDHLAIMGDNGCGKTTILKTILDKIPLLNGKITKLRLLNIGYLAQNDFSLDAFNGNLINYIMETFPSMSETDIRSHLGKFDFTGEEVFKDVKVLSGGEKVRLLLARLVLSNYDLLLLDEPTNHLDIIGKEALLKALQNYNGAIILVSHDRYFVDALANKIIYITQKHVFIGEGNYSLLKDKLLSLNVKEGVKQKFKNEIKIKNKKISKENCLDKLLTLENKINNLKQEQFLEENYMDHNKMNELENKIALLQKQYDELLEYYVSNYDE